jgi:hypothetical protein
MMKSLTFGCVLLLALTVVVGTEAQERLETVSDIAEPSPVIPGVPRASDVCFSPRWPRKRPGGQPLEVARQFHATRLEWVYLGDNSEFCRGADAIGATVCGSVNSNLPDRPTGPATYEIGRARDVDGNRVLPGFMEDWGCFWGCANNPEFRRIWLDHAEVQVRAGAVRIQNDGPRLTEGGMRYWGGCYCEHCNAAFPGFLAQLDPVRLADLDLGDVSVFDYAAYLRENRGNPPADEKARRRAATLAQIYEDFQRANVLRFYTEVHAELEKRIGRNVPFSCNNADGFLEYLHQVHDFAMFEAYPNKEGIPEFLYTQRVLPFRRIGKPFVTTFVSDDIALTRRNIALTYAFGQHTIAPWDVFTGAKSPRVFGDPADSADLYGFVRANAALFDGYEEAAVAGGGLCETRYEDWPPVRVRGGSRQVCAVVRARPASADAAVVIHLVDWAAAPEPFTVVLDPRRFFGDRPWRVRLLTPAPYDADVHARAVATGDLSALSVETELHSGRRTEVNVPALGPWGMLVMTPAPSTAADAPWAPMVWAEQTSYYADELQVHMASPTPEAAIHFTTDGTEPTQRSTRYEAPLLFTTDTTLRARAFARNGAGSLLSHAVFRKLQDAAGTLLPDAPSLRGDLVLWLSADVLDESLADGEPVSEWPARVGPSAAHTPVTLLDGSVATPPVFRADRARGQPVVEFSQTSHHLGIAGFAQDHLAGKRFTIFMVARSDDPYFGFSGNARSGSGGVPRLYVTRSSLHYDALRGIPTGAPRGLLSINTYMHDGGVLRTWVDGHPRGTRIQEEPLAEFGAGGHLAIPFWSGSAFHGGELAELVILDRALSETERVGIENYLAGKYSVRGNPKWR